MSAATEFSSVEAMVEDTEVVLIKDSKRSFDYNLNNKAAKSKLIKGAKREVFEIVENSSSGRGFSDRLFFTKNKTEQTGLSSFKANLD